MRGMQWDDRTQHHADVIGLPMFGKQPASYFDHLIAMQHEDEVDDARFEYVGTYALIGDALRNGPLSKRGIRHAYIKTDNPLEMESPNHKGRLTLHRDGTCDYSLTFFWDTFSSRRQESESASKAVWELNHRTKKLTISGLFTQEYIDEWCDPHDPSGRPKGRHCSQPPVHLTRPTSGTRREVTALAAKGHLVGCYDDVNGARGAKSEKKAYEINFSDMVLLSRPHLKTHMAKAQHGAGIHALS